MVYINQVHTRQPRRASGLLVRHAWAGSLSTCMYAGDKALEHEDQPRFSAKDGPLYTVHGVGGRQLQSLERRLSS